MIKESIQEENIIVVNTYTTNTGVPQYIREILTNKKWEIDSNWIIVGNINTSFTSVNRSRQNK